MNYDDYEEVAYSKEQELESLPMAEEVNPDLQGLGNQYLEK